MLKNENILEDMIDILLHLNRCLPIQPLEVIDNVMQTVVAGNALHNILLGGDQLTRK